MFKHKVEKKTIDEYSLDSLTCLAERYQSDKGIGKHNYTALYELLFWPYKNKEINIIEMGLLVGGPEHGNSASRATEDLPSIRMWLDYFPKAHVTGVDISDFFWFKHPRFNFIQLDMGKTEEYCKLYEFAKASTIVIDDASHASDHQQLAFTEIFPLLPSRSIYIIEDLQWQPIFNNKAYPLTSKVFEYYNTKNTFKHPVKEVSDKLNGIKNMISGCFLFTDSYSKNGCYKVSVLQKK